MIDSSIYNSSVQVNTTHYDFSRYVDLQRWNSYYHQIEKTLAFKPKSVLIVGKGDDVVNAILAQQNIKVTTFDFDKTLQPDIWGDVLNIENVVKSSNIKNKFDVLICCQVLEHLPYENFEKILQQFTTIADNVILSVPYSPLHYFCEIKLPIVKILKIRICIHQFWRKWKFKGEHYWEIGHAGYSKHRIIKSINKFFTIKEQFIAPHNYYHLFFILTKK